MHTTKAREAAERRSQTQPAPRNHTPRRAPVQTDWVWPGMTRAQLREMVIEQIG